jgi:actin-like ATPase involved in cell morphogenesis
VAAYTLGVDLGTTYAATAVYREGLTRAIRLEDNSRTSPSLVAPTGAWRDWAVGEAAASHPAVARWFKRELGTGHPIYVDDRPVEPQTLLAAQLHWVLGRVTRHFDEQPTAITLTHPADWGRHRLDLLQQVAETVGLPAVSFQSEPLAAASFFAAQQSQVPEGAVFAVLDLGGGTTDVTIMRKDAQRFVDLASSGSDQGGLDFDEVLLELIEDQLGPDDDIERLDDATVHHLATAAKIELSEQPETVVVLPTGIGQRVRITRDQFETAVHSLAQRCVAHLPTALGRAGLTIDDLDLVLLAGAGSNTPLVGELVTGLIGTTPERPKWPKMSVCFGAAIAAAGSIGQLVADHQRASLPRAGRRSPAPSGLALQSPAGMSGSEDDTADRPVPVDTRMVSQGPPLVDLSAGDQSPPSADHRGDRQEGRFPHDGVAMHRNAEDHIAIRPPNDWEPPAQGRSNQHDVGPPLMDPGETANAAPGGVAPSRRGPPPVPARRPSSRAAVHARGSANRWADDLPSRVRAEFGRRTTLELVLLIAVVVLVVFVVAGLL